MGTDNTKKMYYSFYEQLAIDHSNTDKRQGLRKETMNNDVLSTINNTIVHNQFLYNLLECYSQKSVGYIYKTLARLSQCQDITTFQHAKYWSDIQYAHVKYVCTILKYCCNIPNM